VRGPWRAVAARGRCVCVDGGGGGSSSVCLRVCLRVLRVFAPRGSPRGLRSPPAAIQSERERYQMSNRTQISPDRWVVSSCVGAASSSCIWRLDRDTARLLVQTAGAGSRDPCPAPPRVSLCPARVSLAWWCVCVRAAASPRPRRAAAARRRAACTGWWCGCAATVGRPRPRCASCWRRAVAPTRASCVVCAGRSHPPGAP
jgi:hypothetical protein